MRFSFVLLLALGCTIALPLVDDDGDSQDTDSNQLGNMLESGGSLLGFLQQAAKGQVSDISRLGAVLGPLKNLFKIDTDVQHNVLDLAGNLHQTIAGGANTKDLFQSVSGYLDFFKEIVKKHGDDDDDSAGDGFQVAVAVADNLIGQLESLLGNSQSFVESVGTITANIKQLSESVKLELGAVISQLPTTAQGIITTFIQQNGAGTDYTQILETLRGVAPGEKVESLAALLDALRKLSELENVLNNIKVSDSIDEVVKEISQHYESILNSITNYSNQNGQGDDSEMESDED